MNWLALDIFARVAREWGLWNALDHSSVFIFLALRFSFASPQSQYSHERERKT